MPKRLPISLLLALALVLAAVLASSAPAAAKQAKGKQRLSRIADARELAPRSCRARARAAARRSRRNPSARRNPQARRRIAKRIRSCRRGATDSGGPRVPLYWGASIGEQLTGTQAPWDMGAVAEFEGLAEKQVSLINFFAPFANCADPSACYHYKFAKGPMENIRRHGAIPVFSWSSQSIPSKLDEPDFQLSDVLEGHHDSYIRSFAEEARDWGHPFFLRFNWEMNGTWFPWSEGVNGNRPGEFVAAWRHVHDIFEQVGASNATWVWCPNIDPSRDFQDLSSLYPGDEYVDWTGLDGYNWGAGKAAWASFDSLYRSTYDEITGTIAPSKPLLIGEMGSSERGGSKAEWITDALESIPTSYPKIRAMLWFDTFDDGMDWPIETSASAAGAFASAIQDPAYRTNSYAELGPETIAPPS